MPVYNAIVNALELNPSILVELADEFPANLRKEHPITRKWSAHEHIAHLARVEVMIGRRLKQMLEHPDRPIVPYDPQHDDPGSLLAADWEESLNEYQWHRAEMVGALGSLSREAWETAVVHPEYPQYSIRVMARHVALHDGLHGYRIEELLAVFRDR